MGLLPLHGGGTEHLQALHPSVHHAQPVHVLNHGKVSYIFKKTIIFFFNFIGKKYPYQYELKAVRPLLCFYYHYYHYEKKKHSILHEKCFPWISTLLCHLIDPNSGRGWNWINNTTIVFQGNYYLLQLPWYPHTLRHWNRISRWPRGPDRGGGPRTQPGTPRSWTLSSLTFYWLLAKVLYESLCAVNHWLWLLNALPAKRFLYTKVRGPYQLKTVKIVQHVFLKDLKQHGQE